MAPQLGRCYFGFDFEESFQGASRNDDPASQFDARQLFAGDQLVRECSRNSEQCGSLFTVTASPDHVQDFRQERGQALRGSPEQSGR